MLPPPSHPQPPEKPGPAAATQWQVGQRGSLTVIPMLISAPSAVGPSLYSYQKGNGKASSAAARPLSTSFQALGFKEANAGFGVV